jgi:WD40 repeat protein
LERNRGERVYWIRTRALDTGQILNQWKHARSGNWLSWNANTLLVGDANEAWIYHPDSGRLIRRLPGNEHSLAVSRDGRFVARSHKDKRLQIIEMATGSEITRGSHDTVVDRLAFTPNGDYLATVDKEDRRIRFWSFRQSSAFAVLQEREPIIEIGFSDDTSSLRTRTAWQENLWRLPAPGSRSSLEHQPAPAAEAPTAQRYDLSLSTPLPDAGPATIEIRNSPGGPIVRSMTFDAPLLSSVASRARNLLAVILCTGSTRGGCRRHLETWDIRTGEKIASRQLAPLLDEQAAAYLDFAGGGQFLVASVRGGIEILDAAQLNPITTLYHPEVMLTAVNSSGSLVATKGKDDEMLIWDLAGSTMIARIPNVQPLRALALSNDQRWLAGLEKDGVGRLWLLNPEDLIQQVCRWLDEPCP